jgi:Tol biopolymer transport system component
MMKRLAWSAALAAGAIALISVTATPVQAQYFGRNKVQYENFSWRILKSDHFDLFFYPAESAKVADAGREAERWYTRYSDMFRHQFDRKSIVFYADHPDFEQTNVVQDQPGEETGGVTEGLRTRVVLPFSGVYKDDEHVLGHELVHVFQYNIAETAPGQGGLARLGALPLWLIEGMAEYFSLGRNDDLTAMWMRDAVQQNAFPTIKQLTTDPRFFPYRYGQALWAYIGGRWGDRAIVDVYRTALRIGWDPALVRALGVTSDSLSKDWAAANRAYYSAVIRDRTPPDSVGTPVVALKKRSEFNVGPSVSPDGKYLAYLTSRTNLFGMDLVLADASTGRIIRKLASPQQDSHFDAISSLNSAGAWSPDGSHFAFIVFKGGNNEIAIVNVSSGDIEKQFKVAGLGAIYHIAWSPDGKQLAVSGAHGGISDLYLVDWATGAERALTSDKYADLQPTFSPDGRTIAFATDRTPETNFQNMTFGELHIATLNLATDAVTLQPGFPRGKHINPQFSPDGRSIYFVSDQDGIPDVYRLDLASSVISRLTRVSTGISGITALSPAITVASQSGRVLVTVFKAQGHEILALNGAQLGGQPMDVATAAQQASIATLPPGDVAGSMTVSAYLKDPMTGLQTGSEFRVVPYHASFSLDVLGQPTAGVTAGGPYGTGFVGGISALFGDQLSDQQIFTAINANGTVKDFGGALFYQNLKRRLNWLAGLQHVPILYGYQYAAYGDPDHPQVGSVITILQRIFIDEAQLSAQYPLSTTRRFETGISATRLGYEQEKDSILYDPFSGQQLSSMARSNLGGPPAVYYAQPTVAYVGDNSFAAYTSPISGMRFRLEDSPTFGSVTFNTALADGRRYFFMRPFTFAVRALHYGRYGRDADRYDKLSPLYLGEETLIRGYGYGSFQLGECGADTTTATGANGRCPTFERLLGSRLAVFNAEFRIPFFGSSQFGLIDFPYLPLEIAPFFDAGLAWTADQPPDLQFVNGDNTAPASCSGDAICARRIPVMSTGVSFRANVFGYMILETYIAHPFQRPGRNWVMGVQVAPGW